MDKLVPGGFHQSGFRACHEVFLSQGSQGGTLSGVLGLEAWGSYMSRAAVDSVTSCREPYLIPEEPIPSLPELALSDCLGRPFWWWINKKFGHLDFDFWGGHFSGR